VRHGYDCHVRFSDVDVYGHVNNVKYFEYYQEARIAFLLSLADGELHTGSSLRQVVAGVDVDYRRPILFRPEPYLVQTWVTRIGTSSYDMASRIVDPAVEGRDATLYSRAQVRLVTFDTATQRSRPLEPDERARLERVLEAGS
jgi:acyl-CoA thioester hydrolase